MEAPPANIGNLVSAGGGELDSQSEGSVVFWLTGGTL